MKKISYFVFLIACLGACASNKALQQGNSLVADPELVKPVAQCENSREDSKRYIAFLKQWHLSPKANTVLSDPKTFDQFENQYAIYKQIEKWVLAGALDTVVVEGCDDVDGHRRAPIMSGRGVERWNATRSFSRGDLGNTCPCKPAKNIELSPKSKVYPGNQSARALFTFGKLSPQNGSDLTRIGQIRGRSGCGEPPCLHKRRARA